MEVFDIETIEINKQLHPYAIAYSNNQEYKYIILSKPNGQAVLNIIMNNFKTNTIYYAHNLLFDFLLFLSDLVISSIKFK